MTELQDLPDELLSLIVNYLLPVFSFQPENSSSIEERTTENRGRRRGLASLCLSERRLGRITKPVLYSEIVIGGDHLSATVQVSNLLTTLIDRPSLAKGISHLEVISKYVLDRRPRLYESPYMEVEGHGLLPLQLPSETLYCSLYGNKEWTKLTAKAEQTAAFYFGNDRLEDWKDRLSRHPDISQLALLIHLVPDIKGLSLAMDLSPSLFDFVDVQGYRECGDGSTPNYLQKLEYLSIKRVDHFNEAGHFLPSRGTVPSLDHMPALRSYLQSGPCMLMLPSPGIQLHALESLHFQDMGMPLLHMVEAVRCCTGLKTMSCDMSGNQLTGPVDFSEFLEPLSSSRATLQSLMISINSPVNKLVTKSLGSLVDFTSLGTLLISEFAILGQPDDFSVFLADEIVHTMEADYKWTTFKPAFRLSERLPPSLEAFTISADSTIMGDHTGVLWDFADDLHVLSRLKTVQLIQSVPDPCPRLTSLYASRGISFSALEQLL